MIQNEWEGHDRVSIEEVEALLVQLSGIISVRINANDWGAIEEIHILATAERNPKQIVRDIESSMAAKWGMNVDHKKISIAQLTGMKSGKQLAQFELMGVELSSDMFAGTCEVSVLVSVTGQDRVARGSVSGSHTRSQTLRLTAQAAATAVNQLIDERSCFTVDGVKLVTVLDTEIVVTTATFLSWDGNEETVAGAEVIIEDDKLEAVAESLLHCVRRRSDRVVLRMQKKVKEREAHKE